MNGQISVLYTIWCATCSHWEYMDTYKRARVPAEAKKRGWLYIEILGGWICKDCQDRMKVKIG